MNGGSYITEHATEWAQAQTWRFTSYYKFRFTYTATDADGHTGTATVGGPSGDDIYKFEMNAEMPWADLHAQEPDWTISNPDGAVIFSDQRPAD